MTSMRRYFICEHKTAREARQGFMAAGLSGPALDACLKAGAKYRHNCRTNAAYDAAMAWARNVPHGAPHSNESSVLAALAILADTLGTGGSLTGEGQHKTVRFLAFAECGKGRKLASDGDAWTAAIGESLRFAMSGHMVVRPTGATIERPSRAGEMLVEAKWTAGPDKWIAVFGRDWFESIVLAALGVRVGTPPSVVFLMEDIAEWGKIYNSLCRPEWPALAEYGSAEVTVDHAVAAGFCRSGVQWIAEEDYPGRRSVAVAELVASDNADVWTFLDRLAADPSVLELASA